MSQIICALTSNSHEAIRPTGSTGLPMPFTNESVGLKALRLKLYGPGPSLRCSTRMVSRTRPIPSYHSIAGGPLGVGRPGGQGWTHPPVAIPVWVKQAINAWMTAAGIEDGRLVRSISKGGKVGKSLGAWSAWPVVEQSAKEIGIAPLWSPRPAPGRAPSSAGRTAATWNRSNSSWGTP
jgi:hypothetical protein